MDLKTQKQTKRIETHQSEIASSSPRAVATGSHHEKPILPKIMRQKSFNTINQ